MKELSQATFDYSDLPTETKGKLISLAGQIKKGRQHYIAAVFEVGQAIATAHGLLADHDEGTFGKWIENECGIEKRTAYNYMHAWETFGEQETNISVTPTAMYLLSAAEAPEKAAKEAIKRADKGERITVVKAKEILEKFRENEPASIPRKGDGCEIISQLKPVEAKEVMEIEASKAESDDPIGDACQHEWDDDGDCTKCRINKSKVNAPSGGTTFNPSEWTADTGHTGPMKRVFETAAEFEPARQHLVNLKKWLNRVKGLPGGEMIQKGFQRIVTDLDNLDAEIKFAHPFAACVCGGKDNCKVCKGMGWLTKMAYDAAPKEKRRATA